MDKPKNLVADDVVVGEGVALDIPPAGIALRIGAGAIDVIAAIITMIALSILFAVLPIPDEAIAHVLIITIIVTGLLLYPVTMETLTRGRSIGKFIFGTRVVRDDMGPSGLQQAIVRHVIGIVEIWMMSGTLGICAMLVTRKSRRLGDMAAGTVVIKERIPLKVQPPMPMPPHLQMWAHSADVASLPTGLALGIRQFIARRDSLHPQARNQLALHLARHAEQYVYPRPSGQVHPEDFLMAITAERARRDGLRIARNRRLSDRILHRTPSAHTLR
ncbi:MAG: RDD family protein [Actinomycetaceae bacterium]|nr:RDD family protein [Actinomycetaceae bacterium]